MKLVKALPLFLVMIAGSAFGYDHSLSWKAESLERQAYHLVNTIRNRTGYSHATADARRFAREVRHFRRSVQNGARRWHLRRDFRFISQKYYHLRNTVDRSHRLHHSQHVFVDMQGLKRKFRRLRRELYHGHYHHY